jgi:hypothetical protein
MTSKRTRKSEWYWTPPRDLAAERVALDAVSDAEIAKEVGVARRTISDWKLVPEFAERVEEHRIAFRAEAEAARARIRTTGFAIIEERVKRKNERLRQLEQIRVARAAAAGEDAEWLAQGGSTGLVIRRDRSVGQGPLAVVVTDYSIDTDLIRTETALDEAIAKELGQHIEKREVMATGSEPVHIIFEGN